MKIRIAIFFLIVALSAASVVQTFRHRRSEAERQRLAAQVDELRARLAAVTRAVEPSANAPVLERDQTELLRLRNQAAQLRTATNELNDLRRQHEQLLAESQRLRAAQPAASGGAPGQPPAPDTFPKDSWKFAGLASPEATLESVVFSLSQGDHRALLTTLTPDEAEKTQKSFENKSEEQIADEARRKLGKVNSYRIIDRKDVSTDEVVLLVYARGGDDKVQAIRMRKIGEEWRFAGPLTD